MVSQPEKTVMYNKHKSHNCKTSFFLPKSDHCFVLVSQSLGKNRPKMHFLKKGRKIWARSDPQPHPTPLFGQYPKENVALLFMSSLKVLNIVNVLNAGVRCAFGNVYLCCIIVMFLLITSIKTKTLTKGAYRVRNHLS